MEGWEAGGRVERVFRRSLPASSPHPMIELSDADVAEFRSLFRRETGLEIDDEQARAYATNLIELVAFVLRPRSGR